MQQFLSFMRDNFNETSSEILIICYLASLLSFTTFRSSCARQPLEDNYLYLKKLSKRQKMYFYISVYNHSQVQNTTSQLTFIGILKKMSKNNLNNLFSALFFILFPMNMINALNTHLLFFLVAQGVRFHQEDQVNPEMIDKRK